MQSSDYNQVGNYTAIAGVAVLLLAKFGVATDVQTVVTIIGAGISLLGIIKQFIAHRDLAVKSGAISH